MTRRAILKESTKILIHADRLTLACSGSTNVGRWARTIMELARTIREAAASEAGSWGASEFDRDRYACSRLIVKHAEKILADPGCRWPHRRRASWIQSKALKIMAAFQIKS